MSVQLNNGSTTGRPTFSLADNTNEQEIFSNTLTRPRIVMAYLDLNALTVNATIAALVKIGGATQRKLGTDIAWVAASSNKGVVIGPYYVGEAFAVDITSAGVEGAARAIPYHVIEQMLDD